MALIAGWSLTLLCTAWAAGDAERGFRDIILEVLTHGLCCQPRLQLMDPLTLFFFT